MKLTDFEHGYVECALWSSTDNSEDAGGEPLDKNYSIHDIDHETLKTMIADCDKFQEANADMLEESYTDYCTAGHDFWLTRNGHGVGFWDRVKEPNATKLSAAAKAFGEVNLYVGDDGRVYA